MTFLNFCLVAWILVTAFVNGLLGFCVFVAVTMKTFDVLGIKLP